METESKKLCRGAAVHLHRRTRSAPDSCFILGEPSPPTNRFFRQDTVWMFQACPCSSETTSKPETQLDPTSVSWSLSCGGHHPSLVLTWPRLVFGAPSSSRAERGSTRDGLQPRPCTGVQPCCFRADGRQTLGRTVFGLRELDSGRFRAQC